METVASFFLSRSVEMKWSHISIFPHSNSIEEAKVLGQHWAKICINMNWHALNEGIEFLPIPCLLFLQSALCPQKSGQKEQRESLSFLLLRLWWKSFFNASRRENGSHFMEGERSGGTGRAQWPRGPWDGWMAIHSVHCIPDDLVVSGCFLLFTSQAGLGVLSFSIPSERNKEDEGRSVILSSTKAIGVEKYLHFHSRTCNRIGGPSTRITSSFLYSKYILMYAPSLKFSSRMKAMKKRKYATNLASCLLNSIL